MRYQLFGCNDFYPSGSISDLQGAYDSPAFAKQQAEKIKRVFDNVEIFDTKELKLIASYRFGKLRELNENDISFPDLKNKKL